MCDKTRWHTPARFKLLLSSFVLLGPLLRFGLMLAAIWQGSYLFKTVQVVFAVAILLILVGWQPF